MTTTAPDPVFVSQIELAKDLNVTDRRVRQLVTERILPPARDEGHDLALSRERYRIYSSGSERDWDKLFDEAEDAARLAGELSDRAFAADAGLEDIKAASIAIQRSTVLMSFLTACRAKSDEERRLFWNWWDKEEGQALSGLLAHAMTFIGKTHLITDDGDIIEMVPAEMAVKANKKPLKRKPVAKKRGAK